MHSWQRCHNNTLSFSRGPPPRCCSKPPQVHSPSGTPPPGYPGSQPWPPCPPLPNYIPYSNPKVLPCSLTVRIQRFSLQKSKQNRNLTVHQMFRPHLHPCQTTDRNQMVVYRKPQTTNRDRHHRKPRKTRGHPVRRKTCAWFAVTGHRDTIIMPWLARVAKGSSEGPLPKTRITPANMAIIVKSTCTCGGNAKLAGKYHETFR